MTISKVNVFFMHDKPNSRVKYKKVCYIFKVNGKDSKNWCLYG